MALSYVEFVGALKEPEEVSINGETGRMNYRYEFRQGFSVRHQDKEDLGVFINKAFQELAMLRGMMVHKKEPHDRFDFNNQRFIPLERFQHIDCVVKPMVDTEAPDPDGFDKPKGKAN